MSTVCVRPFRRADREQLTVLVNARVQAVTPGVSVSVNTVMSQLVSPSRTRTAGGWHPTHRARRLHGPEHPRPTIQECMWARP